MDISVTAPSVSYSIPQAYNLQGGAGSRSTPAAVTVATHADTLVQSGASQGNASEAQSSTSPDQQLQEARKKSPAAEVNSQPGFAFELDPKNHRVMKVNDNKGVLIYQVPSKGQLALIEAQESAQKTLRLTA
jgi:hypothetical protein